MKRGINKDDIKAKNRGLVLKLIASNQNLSRVDITRLVGLTKMSISNIVGELIQNDYVVETAISENNHVGRNPISLAISPKAPQLAGAYISRDRLQVFLCNLSCQTIYKTEVSFSSAETEHSLTDKLLSLLSQTLQKATAPVLGIGVSAIGPLDIKNGIILNPRNFYGIQNYPIVSILEKEFALPITLNNDMNAAALAERLFGYGTSFSNFIYLGISNGIGSGIITDGKLYQDNNGFVGEIGHMGINQNGPICTCGRKGCLELYANMPLILKKLRNATGNPMLTYTDFLSVSNLPECEQIFQDMVDALSYALVNASNMLNPDAVIIGHEGIYLPEKYLLLLQKTINQEILSAGHRQVKVLTSSFGIDAPLMGSVSFLLDDLFSGKMFLSTGFSHVSIPR